MHLEQLRHLLEAVAAGTMTPAQAAERLTSLPVLASPDAGGSATPEARLDLQRPLRTGIPEVVLAEPKTPQQVARLLAELCRAHGRALATRASREHFEAVRDVCPTAVYHATARAITVGHRPPPGQPEVAVLTAGTGDIPVAEEAALTLEWLEVPTYRLYDVGVAGLHRLLSHLPTLRAMRVIVVVAGMDGALPSVVTGLVACPVIGVPTSVGYGAALGGLAPLLNMLNTCAPGLTVVNIDNGFGAACAAALMLRQAGRERPGASPA